MLSLKHCCLLFGLQTFSNVFLEVQEKNHQTAGTNQAKETNLLNII